MGGWSIQNIDGEEIGSINLPVRIIYKDMMNRMTNSWVEEEHNWGYVINAPKLCRLNKEAYSILKQYEFISEYPRRWVGGQSNNDILIKTISYLNRILPKDGLVLFVDEYLMEDEDCKCKSCKVRGQYKMRKDDE